MSKQVINTKAVFNIDKQRIGLNILLHLAIWNTLIIVPFFLMRNYIDDEHFIPWFFYLDIAVYGLIFYVGYLLLVPKFFLKKKKVIYFLSVISLIIVMWFAKDFGDRFIKSQYPDQFPNREMIVDDIQGGDELVDMPVPMVEDESVNNRGPRRPHFGRMKLYSYFLISFIISFLSLGLRAMEQVGESERKQKELEKEKLNSELAFLKNQISPHFFFNTLNNIYSLVEINTTDAQHAILKLSKLMRYLLYESENGETRLSDEVSFMNNYIDLMQLRVSQKVEVKADFEDVKSNFTIPPLLFIPFVENAFKHGISYREESFIHVSMRYEDDKLFFSCINSLHQNTAQDFNKAYSGIGLENVTKRLHLIYPDNHTLKIDQEDGKFIVDLCIKNVKTDD
jgi:two-component sensor histidine kinase